MADTSPPRGRGRPRTVDRDKAVQIALSTWWSRSVYGVSLNEICRASGLSKSSVYREFGGADGLMEAALARYEALAITPLLELMAAPLPPAEALDRVVQVMTEPRGLPAGCFFTKLRLAPPNLGEATRARVEQMIQRRRTAFAAWFERARELCLTNPDLDAETAAHYLDGQLTLVMVALGAGEPVHLVRRDAGLAVQVVLRP